MKKDILLDLATETVRRYGSLPPDFAEKMAKRIRRKFAVKIEPAKINDLALHYKEVYDFGKSIFKDSLTPPKGIYAEAGDVDHEKFLENLVKNFPDDDSDRMVHRPFVREYNSPAMSILDSHTIEFFSRSPEQTRRIGMRLGGELKTGDVICLQGDLGAGKTTFVQGLAQGWGSQDSVSSPTFIIVNLYRRANGAQLFHLDTYRLESVPEAEELDLESMLAEGALVIEWPERLGALIPGERLWINLDHIKEEHRQMRFNAKGKRYDELLEGIRQSIFGGA